MSTSPGAAEPPIEAERRAGCFRIAHVSDLHFGKAFDDRLWAELVNRLKRGDVKVDLVVVTGDHVDSHGFFALALARNQLQELSDSLQCDIQVVPGNHDVGLKGNVKLPFLRSAFDAVFSPRNSEIVARFPAFIEYTRRSWYHRWSSRAWYALVLLFVAPRLWWRRQKGVGTGLLPTHCAITPSGSDASRSAPTPALVVGFDSNHALWLASGRVDEEAIHALSSELDEVRLSSRLQWMCPRIALVHHHVTPIPFANSTESATEFEPFLVLRNAGTLAQQLAMNEFDLVLHGHKHFRHSLRLEFDQSSGVTAELAVVGAGSPTVRLREPGRNSFNVLELQANGSIFFWPVLLGSSANSDIGRALQRDAGPRAIMSMQATQRRALRKAVARVGCLAETVTQTVNIRRNGSASIELELQGLRARGTRVLAQLPLSLEVHSGAVPASSVKLAAESRASGHAIEDLAKIRPSRKVDISLRLGQELGGLRGESHGCQVKLHFEGHNSFAITNWEAHEIYGNHGDDWSAMVIRVPTQRACLRVKLLPGLESVRPRVRVCRPPNYPLLAFNSSGFPEVPDLGSEQWIVDHDLSRLESGQLRQDQEGYWELVVQDPLLGFRYGIQWEVALKDDSLHPQDVGTAQALREALLRSPDATDPQGSRFKQDATAVMGDMLQTFWLPQFCAQHSLNEAFSAAVWVCDTSSGDEASKEAAPNGTNNAHHSLRVCLEAGNVPEAAKLPEMEVNLGVTGRAFKTRRSCVYVHRSASTQPIHPEGSSDFVVYANGQLQPSGRQGLHVVAAIPLLLPSRLETDESSSAKPPELLVGILTLSSNAPDSGLLSMVHTIAARDPAGMARESPRPAPPNPSPTIAAQGREPQASDAFPSTMDELALTADEVAKTLCNALLRALKAARETGVQSPVAPKDITTP